MRILDRYITRGFCRLFVLFVLSAPLLFILGDLVDHLDDYLDKGLTPTNVALGYVYQLPLFILWSFPIAALIATIFTVSNMTRHSEVTAAKAGGVSFRRLMLPLVVLGVLLTGAAFGLSELVPIGTRLKAQVMGEKTAAQDMRSDFVYRSNSGDVFAIRRLDVEHGHIYGLSVEREGDEPRIPSVHIEARDAQYSPDTGWTLDNGYLRLMSGPGKENSFHFSRLIPVHLTETPEQLLAVPKEPDEMGYAELGHYIHILRQSGGKPFQLMVKQAQKIAIPVATVIIILFGAPLANASPRGGTTYGIGVALGITVVYMMLFRFGAGLASGGTIPPFLGAWAPNFLFLAAAIVLQWRVET